jgi:Transposase domain (DUF772)
VVALLLYAYARGERSSRGIERRCVEDVAYRVIACQQTPDHATIARFRVCHEAALAGLFSEVLGLCRESGLVKVGVITVSVKPGPAQARVRTNEAQPMGRQHPPSLASVSSSPSSMTASTQKQRSCRTG